MVALLVSVECPAACPTPADAKRPPGDPPGGRSGCRKRDSARGLRRLFPPDLKLSATTGAHHPARPPDDGPPLATARAHGIAVTPGRRQPHGVARPRHHGPPAGWFLDDFKEWGGHLELLTTYFDHGLERSE